MLDPGSTSGSGTEPKYATGAGMHSGFRFHNTGVENGNLVFNDEDTEHIGLVN